MNFSIPENDRDNLFGSLKAANLKFQQVYPGDKPDRQPVHTMYGGADLFRSDTCKKMGEIALKSLQTYAPNFVVLAKVLRFQGFRELPTAEKKIEKLVRKMDRIPEKERKRNAAWMPYSVYEKILKKLRSEAVEDFRIDFEDGFGNRPDEEEDATATRAASELAKGMQDKTLSPFIGIRIKPFTEDLKYR
jgi:hypothetical protein